MFFSLSFDAKELLMKPCLAYMNDLPLYGASNLRTAKQNVKSHAQTASKTGIAAISSISSHGGVSIPKKRVFYRFSVPVPFPFVLLPAVDCCSWSRGQSRH
jgi:hypothetical protein